MAQRAVTPAELESRTLEKAYATPLGFMWRCKVESFLDSDEAEAYWGKVQLILTSPPFPLNRKKKYGNLQGKEYLSWLAGLAPRLRKLLTPTGSIVIEVGNAWVAGIPTMSTLPLETLLKFRARGRFYLCQQFICYNPNRLPSPAQWVNVERQRLKDAHTHIWWMSRVPWPKADNRQVLQPYSEAMKELLERQRYNAGPRPSEHNVGEKSFLKDNGGAIPSSVLTISNTRSHDPYLAYCRMTGIDPHPARMPIELADFFIRLLTDTGDLVCDPFAGSNTTGAAAEHLKRRWIAMEPEESFIQGSRGRFQFLVDQDSAEISMAKSTSGSMASKTAAYRSRVSS